MDGPPPHPPIADDGTAALAYDLARANAGGALVFIDATGERLDALAEAAAFFAPGVDVRTLPAWDTLPYDRAAPSPGIVGRRVATLSGLAATPDARHLVLTSARAVMQRVPPPSTWGPPMTLRTGDTPDRDALIAWLDAAGYAADEIVDAPGAYASRAHTIDVFPGDAPLPARLLLSDGVIVGVHDFDPVTQLSGAGRDAVALRPVREYEAGAKPDLVSVLDYLPGAMVVLHGQTEDRWTDWAEQASDAHAAVLRASRANAPAYLPPPGVLFTSPDALRSALEGQTVRTLAEPAAANPSGSAPQTLTALAAALADEPTVLAAGADAARIAKRLARDVPARFAPDWAAAADPKDVAVIPLTIDRGFTRDGVRVIPLPPALRTRGPTSASVPSPLAEEPPRAGDIVVHRDHGVCRLSGLRAVDAEERVALEFYEGTELLIPAADLSALWRYGTDTGRVTLDRLHGEAWSKRRDEIAAEIARTAAALVAQSRARAAMTAPVIETGKAYSRFANRFAYPPSPDQQAAIDATLADMAAGTPMDRLVCGDVGFGKTEVALRAAAAAALAGHQVAVIAPTTVLARQHFETFTRRFQGFPISVAFVGRGATATPGKAIRDGLADGSIQVAVGTHALASEKLRFKNLALVVIDEEQRFGDAQKARLAARRNPDGGVHALVMSATPIPRTLQSAMVGLRQVSVIATPPVRRRPTRTFVLPAQDAMLAEPLLREHRRGGQSFVVAPRIEDLPALEAKLRALVPDLAVVTAHGRQKPEVLERTVGAFASGDGDVLLATSIIEAGLDIPNANTILITRPDRFGLSQLHQMRGRVGRGTTQGFAYLLTDPARPLPTVTERRLRTLEHQAQLGAGLAISVADLDARGAGELFGSTQAGHVHAIGTELYQHLLAETLASVRGEPPRPLPPDLRVEIAGRIPQDYVAEPDVRLDIYRRLARVADAAALDALADELDDRFGPVPDDLSPLLSLARLRLWCEAHGVARVDAGPQAIALTPAEGTTVKALHAALPGADVKGERVILPLAIADAAERLQALLATTG